MLQTIHDYSRKTLKAVLETGFKRANNKPRLRRRIFFKSTFLIMVCIFSLFHLYPLPASLEHIDYSKVLFSQKDELIGAKISTDHQWRFPPSETLSDKYQIALIQFEDQYFWQHPGINPVSIIKAFKDNLQSKRVVRGGSTITMQLARILRQDPARNYFNKLIEIVIALKLEWHLSKSEILEHYANMAPFGGNIIGINTASWRYFGRSADQQSWAEAALLAVLPNSPSLIHPGRGRKALKAKRDRLLNKLFNAQHMSTSDLKLSLLEPLPERPKSLPKLAPRFFDSLIAKQPSQHVFKSTIDKHLQSKLRYIVQHNGIDLATQQGVHNLSVVVINHREHSTAAYIGNQATVNKHSNANGPSLKTYSPNVDIAKSNRSTGSILKPLLYALMLESGDITPNMLIPDIPSHFKGFTPENYDHSYRGAVPAYQALAQSLNIPAVRMLRNYGYPRFAEDLKDLGLSSLFRPADDYGLTLILGGAEANLWELTQIYAHLFSSARGDNFNSSSISPVRQLKNGLTAKTPKRSIDQGAAWLTLDALLNVGRPGTEQLWKEFSSSQKIAWKTGTSYGLRDAWAIGSNGQFTVGVWAGNAGGEGAASLSGLNSAAPTLFHTFQMLGRSQWLEMPIHALKSIETCEDNGFLSGGLCLSELSYIPKISHFQTITPHHKKIHLDSKENYRVHNRCEKVSNMVRRSVMILPPIQNFYWRKHNDIETHLPPWRSDCLKALPNIAHESPMEIQYPNQGAEIYLPFDLNGEKGEVIFKITHRRQDSKVYWHIDNQFITSTSLFHETALSMAPGWHQLLLVDDKGFELKRRFKVL